MLEYKENFPFFHYGCNIHTSKSMFHLWHLALRSIGMCRKKTCNHGNSILSLQYFVCNLLNLKRTFNKDGVWGVAGGYVICMFHMLYNFIKSEQLILYNVIWSSKLNCLSLYFTHLFLDIGHYIIYISYFHLHWLSLNTKKIFHYSIHFLWNQ